MVKKINGIFSKIQNQTQSTKLFTLQLEEPLEFESGQFINLIFEHENQTYTKPYSIASSKTNQNEIELSINLVENGKATPKLWEKQEGDECKIMGPLGLFKLNQNSLKEKIALIGTGTGIAPLRSIFLELLEQEKEITLIFGNRFENEILFEKELDKIENRNPNFKIIKTISRPTDNWEGRTGYVQNNLDTIDVLNSEFYICGRPEMVEQTKQKLIELGADNSEIHNEKYV